MKKDVQNIIIGILFLMGISITTYYALLDKRMDTSAIYYAQFKNADGVSINSPIYLAGVKVGSVKDIVLKNGHVNLTLSLSDTIKIPSDSTLQIETLDLFASKSLSISPGFEEDILQRNTYFEFVQNSVDFIGLLNEYLDGRINNIKKKKAQ